MYWRRERGYSHAFSSLPSTFFTDVSAPLILYHVCCSQAPPVFLFLNLCHFLSMVYSSTLKMEGIGSSEMVTFCQTTRRHIVEDMSLHTHQHENLRPHSSINELKYLIKCTFMCAEQLLPFFTVQYISFLSPNTEIQT
jgi:hypothetical protein